VVHLNAGAHGEHRVPGLVHQCPFQGDHITGSSRRPNVLDHQESGDDVGGAYRPHEAEFADAAAGDDAPVGGCARPCRRRSNGCRQRGGRRVRSGCSASCDHRPSRARTPVPRRRRHRRADDGGRSGCRERGRAAGVGSRGPQTGKTVPHSENGRFDAIPILARSLDRGAAKMSSGCDRHDGHTHTARTDDQLDQSGLRTASKER